MEEICILWRAIDGRFYAASTGVKTMPEAADRQRRMEYEKRGKEWKKIEGEAIRKDGFFISSIYSDGGRRMGREKGHDGKMKERLKKGEKRCWQERVDVVV